MTRSDLIRNLTERKGDISKKTMELAVKQTIDLMVDTLAQKERIEIRGFGCFSLRYRPPRVARNPQNGKFLNTDGKFAIHFKPGKELKERVNNF